MPWANPTSPNLPDFYLFLQNEVGIEALVMPPGTVAAAPGAPALTAGGGGSLPAGSIYAVATYLSAFGETAGSLEASVSVSANGSVSVASPAAAAFATGWNLYAATSAGAETLQNSAPIAIGTAFSLVALGASNATPPVINTTGWTWAYYAFRRALGLVPTIPTVDGLDYTITVYNAAAHILLGTAPDQKNQTFFAGLRDSFKLNAPSSGVIQSSGDQGTSNSLTVPESLQRLTVQDLWFFKTPYGRAYLGFCQDFGEIAGLT